MKKKIVVSLLLLLLFFAIGAVASSLYIKTTTSSLERLIRLHQIGNLRQELIMSIQAVQSELYTVGTELGHNTDIITESVSRLETNARACTGCHHQPDIESNLRQIQSFISDYQNAISFYITAVTARERSDRLKEEAAIIGNKLLQITEQMSLGASRKLTSMTTEALRRIHAVRTILLVTIIVTFLVVIFIAIRLTSSITKPINALVSAARAIASGNLRHRITYQDRTEFGELADNFNLMSSVLQEGYERLEKEVAERKQAEAAFRESEQRYALAAQGANDGLWDWDLKDNRIYYSLRWKSMLGYDDGEIGDSPDAWFSRLHVDDREKIWSRINTYVMQGGHHLEIEYRILHKDGTFRWMLCRGLAIRDAEDRPTRMAGSQTDITARKIAEEQLLHDAFHDALTGLANRALFRDRLHNALNRSKRIREYIYAVMFFDVDRFKVINDSLGHAAGDRLLVEIGKRIAGCVRPGDTIARLGGDEFAVLMENITDVADVKSLVERIQAEFIAPFQIKGNEIYVTQSIGIALELDRYEQPDQILSDADIAMYAAKSKGKARYEIFDDSMHTYIVERLQLEADLRTAVEHQKDFVLHYQPILDVNTRELIGFEALVRWHHPLRGIIPPLDFIPLAEETGLIHPLGDWILREACRQLKQWQAEYHTSQPLKMSANVSGKQFLNENFVDRLITILDEIGTAPNTLAIEITESIIMEDIDIAVKAMNRLRNIGVQIHIDDFGTGYSSLSYLNKFPVTALKIDRSFISSMSLNEENREIVRAIVSLAQNLNLKVIAEGIELPAQLAEIGTMECHFAQGYFFSRPVAASDMAVWMEKEELVRLRS